MRKLGLMSAAAAIAAVMGFAGSAWADPYADSVVSFTPVTPGTAADGTAINTSGDSDEPAEGGTDATGGPDWSDFNQFVSLGIDENSTADTSDDTRGEIVLDFSDNLCLGVSGADIRVFEPGDNEDYTLEVELNGGSFSTPTTGSGDDDVDLFGVSDGDLFNRVRITATNFAGSTNVAGADIDAVECLAPVIAGDFNKTNTGLSTVDIGLDTTQAFSYEITITNNTGVDDALNRFVAFDVIPAEFDLDPVTEDLIDGDDTNDCTGTGEDGLCDGVNVDANCAVTIGGPAIKPGKLEPHFLTIEIDLDVGESCTTGVFVTTDQNPASAKGNKETQYEPTSCDLVWENGTTVYNTITLNEGIKVFDKASGDLIFGPKDSIQLQGLGCL